MTHGVTAVYTNCKSLSVTCVLAPTLGKSSFVHIPSLPYRPWPQSGPPALLLEGFVILPLAWAADTLLFSWLVVPTLSCSWLCHRGIRLEHLFESLT